MGEVAADTTADIERAAEVEAAEVPPVGGLDR
jgi:hypothetical protein